MDLASIPQTMKGMALSYLEQAEKNRLVSQNDMDLPCEQLKFNAWIDNTYKNICSGAMTGQVRPINHKSVSIF